MIKQALTTREAQEISQAAIADYGNSYERYCEAQDAAWERQRANSTCADCQHCEIAPESDMHPLIKYVTHHIGLFYDFKKDNYRTEASVEYDLSRALSNAVLKCAWCTEYSEFIDAERTASECEEFIAC